MSQMMSVSSLNTKIKSLLEATFMHILVEGEVASVTYHSSGHLYFSIKDSESSIKCVMWRSSVGKMKFRIEKGMHLVIEGSVGVYTPRGEYQFYAVKVEPFGQGALAVAYEQLKERLKAKGYFDAHLKKPIPKHIERIVLVTAKESAALHDMLKIIEKRWPLLEVMIVDTLVQGERAAESIAKALQYADTLGAEVIVMGRGGGSAEDLWSFNEEIVADAVFSLETPVVSAVGHEVDVLISDHVADLRAPTPSAAIEMILPDKQEILYMMDEISERFTHIMGQKLINCEQNLRHIQERLEHLSPLRRLQSALEQCHDMQKEYQRLMLHQLERKVFLLQPLKREYRYSIRAILKNKTQQLQSIQSKAEISNPTHSEKKGWVQLSMNGHPVDPEEIKVDEHFIVQNTKTKIEAVALKKEKL